MKLYVTPFAPNALRVQVFMLEKGIEAEIVTLTPEAMAGYRAINPLGQVPSLALDDGTIITESLTICHYLDAVTPPPALFGADPEARARIGMWERRAEMALFNPSIEYGHHTHPMFEGRLVQFPDWARAQVPRSLAFLEVMAERLADVPFLAGEEFSAADITAYLGYFALVAYGAVPRSEKQPVREWAARVAGRDSMAGLRQMAALFGMEAVA